MLVYCRDTFVQMFEQGLNEPQADQDDEDAKEARYRQKEKLFGNISFIAELYIKYLLPEKVIFQILSSLLGSEQVPTDDTLEAGLHFVTKIGPHLEERITKKEKASADLK
jgi:hypothetical protein